MFSEKLPSTYYTKLELKAMNIGTEYEVRKKLQRNNFQSEKAVNREETKVLISRIVVWWISS